MSEYQNRRDDLAAAHRALEARTREAVLAREKVRQLQRALDNLLKVESPRRPGDREKLEEAIKAAEQEEAKLRDSLDPLEGRLDDVKEAFEPFTDPQSAITLWPDNYPILLFPLRLETRFKTSAAGVPELWVRVYPDGCLADSFEETLTQQEVLNGQAFWASIWRAGGDEALERAAWRALATAHGSGRAGWIIQQYLPLNTDDKPVPAAAETLLIVVSPTPLPDEIKPFWEAVWRGGGGAQATQQAFADLEAAIGGVRAAEIVEKYRPFNLADEPKGAATRDTATVNVAVLQLASLEHVQTRRSAWSSAPKVTLLPDRFVLIGYRAPGPPLVALSERVQGPLFVGPDPNAPANDRLEIQGDELNIPDSLKWMFDFDRALKEGMAFRVPLDPSQARGGFDRLVVIGLRLGDSPEDGVKNLAGLLRHHLHSRTGFEIVPQGTPTNNTEKAGSGYSYREDPDETFSVFYQGKPGYRTEIDPLLRRDGQWMADLLGLPQDLIAQVPHAGGQDQADARAMQIALWPGTTGHMMSALMDGVFSDGAIADTHQYFTHYVSGRGPIPAIRIGAQPYGILPAVDFENISWPTRIERSARPNPTAAFHHFLSIFDKAWNEMAKKVNYVGRQIDSEGNPLDPHQVIADVVALHPSAAEYYSLQSDGKDHKRLEMAFYDAGLANRFADVLPDLRAIQLLRDLGYQGPPPPILNQVYRQQQYPLDGPLIDDRPLSETDRIRKYAGNLNYIEWLGQAARAGIQQLQEERGFDGDKKPLALLYLMLRHALQMGFNDAGIKLVSATDATVDVSHLRRDAQMIHVAAEGQASESRYRVLLQPSPLAAGMTVSDHIVKATGPDLLAQIAAVDRLATVPTARLERVFAEHIDCCSYRLDAWKMGLLNWQLQHLAEQHDPATPRGLFLGAYGWLEPVRPKHVKLSPAEMPEEIKEKLEKVGVGNLVTDSGNGGLIHAQSLNHATTAAVLRNGYVSHDNQLAIDLTSRRVRLAIGILEGMRNGQTLGALLGYQYERYVHDHGPLTVRALIYPLRRAFPLVANQIKSAQEDGTGEAKESTAAVNVIDGRKMIEHVQAKNAKTYPFAADPPLPDNPTSAERSVIEAALAHIIDINDAVADLVLAEGVHQAVIGNYDRSAGTLDAFAKGSYPPEPDVIRTPKSGTTLTLRTAIHLLPNATAPASATAMAMAEPGVNAWLKERLPGPDAIKLTVTFTDRATDTERTEPISLTNLGLQPIDILYKAAANPSASTQAETAINLDDEALQYLYAHFQPHHGKPLSINYLDGAGGVSWFQLRPLLRSFNTLLVSARPLQPADIMRGIDAKADEQATTHVDSTRIVAALTHLRDSLIPALDATVATLSSAATAIEQALEAFVGTVLKFSAYHLPGTSARFVYDWRTDTYGRVTTKLSERTKLWEDRKARAQALLDEFDAPPAGATAEEQLARLRAAEVLVSTAITGTPGPNYRSEVGTKFTAFSVQLDALKTLATGPIASLDQLLSDTLAELPLTDFDPQDLDFQEELKEVDRFREQLQMQMANLKKDTQKRIADVEGWLADLAGADLAGQVSLMQKAAKKLFGDDFQIVPTITLPAAAAQGVANAWKYSQTDKKLTQHLTATVGRRFPVDDWLHGVARVRPKMNEWENALLLCEAFGTAASPELTPLQIPYVNNESWLAMEFPPVPKVDGERLLYTANFAKAYVSLEPICGLLVDEWTEVIPEATQTTGVTFHFDRPNSEPPQCWLLAMPSRMDGAWTWEELVGAVNNALDCSKARAVEPAQVGASPYGWFLPATVSAYTFPEISISNNLFRNLRLYEQAVKGEPP
jgi:hypothetical protein